ncbi:cell division protein SepF [bacterium]|nr:cell division protein SepF [bacterium]
MSSLLTDIKRFFGFIDDEEGDQVVSDSNTRDASMSKRPFKGSLVHSQNTRPFASSEIQVLEPKVYEDSLNIAAYLRDNKPVIINLKYLDPDPGKRLIDFVCGTAYAINGHMKKVGEHIFLFTPSNVLIVNDEEKSTFEQGVENNEKQLFFKQAASM